MKYILLIIIFITSITNSSAQTEALFFEQCNEFLKNNVSKEGNINYKTLKKSPGELLYILNNISTMQLAEAPNKEAALAYWINVYNLILIKNVVENYPIKSVNFVAGFFDKTFIINNNEFSLNDIEQRLYDMSEDVAGLHFVLSKASNDIPVLYNGAYLAESALYQISLQVKAAVNKPNFLQINKDTNVVQFPALFKNYKKDFVTMYFNEIDFVNVFLDKKINNKMKIKYADFDWSLNDTK